MCVTAGSASATTVRILRPAFGAWRLASHRSAGFTLIELLITITIIGILSAAILGASQAALGTAKASRTRTTIAKLHTLLTERLASYETRQVEFNTEIVKRFRRAERQLEIARTQGGDAAQYARDRKAFGQVRMDLRLFALRELMRLEMPDRWADVDLGNRGPQFLASQPALSKAYERRWLQISQNNDEDTVNQNQSAECLYLTIMFATGDGEARSLFAEQDIGDTDGDGAPEFLDGWGQPIQYIRWPAGFAGESDLMAGDGQIDHDPFDPFRRDAPAPDDAYEPNLSYYLNHHLATQAASIIRERNMAVNNMLGSNQYGPVLEQNGQPDTYPSAFRLVPLIYSAGPDGTADLFLGLLDDDPVRLNDPYVRRQSLATAQLGTPVDARVIEDSPDLGWKDNIHNHVMEY